MPIKKKSRKQASFRVGITGSMGKKKDPDLAVQKNGIHMYCCIFSYVQVVLYAKLFNLGSLRQTSRWKFFMRNSSLF